MENKILEMCEKLCNKKLMTDEQLIITGLFDSFQLMELICNLEEGFHVTFLPEEISNLENFSCVNNIVDIINTKLKG